MGKFLQTSSDFIYKRIIENKESVVSVSEEMTNDYNESENKTRRNYFSRNLDGIANSINTLIF